MLRYVWIIESLHHYIYIYTYIYIYIYMCVCVCVRVCVFIIYIYIYIYIYAGPSRYSFDMSCTYELSKSETAVVY